MQKTKLNPDEIGHAVLAEMRADDICRNVQDVVIIKVTSPDAEANWKIDSYIADGAAPVSFDCKRRGIAAQEKLQKQFDATWPEGDHLVFTLPR
jgi:hypothetical protein